MKKRCFGLFLLLLTFCCLFPNAARARSAELSGSCGEHTTWTLRDGVLTISGTGATEDYSSSMDVPWHYENWKVESAVIQNGVTSIGERLFDACSKLANVSIPASVTTIGAYAFDGCRSLQEIKIPASVTTIGKWTFASCGSLQEIKIPPSVTTIGEYAFWNCDSLREIDIPASVKVINRR